MHGFYGEEEGLGVFVGVEGTSVMCLLPQWDSILSELSLLITMTLSAVMATLFM